MEFDYTVKTSKDFNSAVRAVEEETAKAGFRVLHIHNVQKSLADGGFEIEPFKIIEICNAKSAYAVLKANVKIGLCLPCKINVYVKDGQTFIVGMRPLIIKQLFPEVELQTLPDEVDAILKNIVDSSR